MPPCTPTVKSNILAYFPREPTPERKRNRADQKQARLTQKEVNAKTIKLSTVIKKKNNFLRKAAMLIRDTELERCAKETYEVFECLPKQKELAPLALQLKNQLKDLEGGEQTLGELICELEPGAAFAEVTSLFLMTIHEIASAKCMNICSTVACTATLLDIQEYDVEESSESYPNSEMDFSVSEQKGSFTLQEALAAMSNDLYKRVCDSYGLDKHSVIYCIKLFCNWLYRFDFASANVELNRFVNDTSV